MKKSVLIIIFLAVVSSKSEAQHFIASFGVQQNWGVPIHVTNIISNRYGDYSWVHASRAHRRGSVFFDLVLQRGDVFIEVSVRNDGYISRRVYRDYYPLQEHVCSHHCGYHTSYYKTYYRDCHSTHHHGHNHVVYINRPKGHAHGYYKNKGHHVYKQRDHNGHGHFKYQKKNDYDRNYDHYRKNSSDYSRQRRDRYFVSNEHPSFPGERHKYKRDERKEGGKNRKNRGEFVSRRK